MKLTVAQENRLHTLTGRVVGLDEECPIIRYPNGRLMKVSKLGRMVSVGKAAEREISERQIECWEQK